MEFFRLSEGLSLRNPPECCQEKMTNTVINISTASSFNGNAPTIRPPARTGSSGNIFSPNGPLVYYPPLHQTWSRIKRVLGELVHSGEA
jgi:hypothetical protein